MNYTLFIAIGLLFLITIIGAIFQRYHRDRVLKLFHTFHVTFLSHKQDPVWGDMELFSNGLQIKFDQPYTTNRGFVKQATLIYNNDLKHLYSLGRTVRDLSSDEILKRQEQVNKHIHPNAIEKFKRGFRNGLGIVQDAVSKSIGLVINRVSQQPGALTQSLGTNKGDVANLSSNILGMAANTYESLLEQNLGQRVIVQIKTESGWTELPFILVEYNAKYLGLYCSEYSPISSRTHSDNFHCEDYHVDLTSNRVEVACNGKEPCIIKTLGNSPINVVLLPGSAVSLRREPDGAIEVVVSRAIDVILPRQLAFVRFRSNDYPHNNNNN
jgi:hypothetical protein